MHPPPNMIVIAFVAVISASAAHMGGGAFSLQTTDPQIFCGRTLAKALALLCSDDASGSKRSDSASIYEVILPPHYKNPELQLDWSWMSRHAAKALSRAAARGKRLPGTGVIDECCDKPCSLNELLTYC